VGFDGAVPGHTHLWRLQTMAKRALLSVVGSASAVRAVQEEAAGRRPLTLCIGHFQRHALEAAVGMKLLPASELRVRAWELIEQDKLGPLPGESWSGGDGCARAHLESASRTRLFKCYCNSCAKGSGNRQRALERRFWALAEGRRGGRGSDYCSACGAEFTSTRPDQVRCEDCRRGHRSAVRKA
jgi:hypothetical protein